jgi:hypothetical protein
MKKELITQFWNNYSEKMIRFDLFSSFKLGLLQAQSALKIESFDLVCAPYQLSMKKAEIFAVLSKEELPFFRHYTTKLATLKLAFQPSKSKTPLKFIVWVAIEKLSMVKGKDNMVMVDLSYKSCPEALIELIGQYFTEQKQLEHYFIKLKDQQLPINNETAGELKFNNYIECIIGQRNVECKLLSLGVNQCSIIIPGIDPNLAEGFEFIVKFYFQRYRFAIKGRIEKLVKRNDGFVSVAFEYGYTPELVDILSEYFLKQHIIDAPPVEA